MALASPQATDFLNSPSHSKGHRVYNWDTAAPDNAIEVLTTGVVVNEDSADLDFRIESNGNANAFVVDGGTDSVGLLGNVNSRFGISIGGYQDTTYTTGATAANDMGGFHIAFAGITAPSTTTGNMYGGKLSAITLTTSASQTHALGIGMGFFAPVKAGTGTFTDMATVYIAGAPSGGGTGNYSLFVDAGDVRLDGVLTVNGQSSVRAYKNASTQTITTGSATKVTLDAEDWDIKGEFATSTFTPTVAGKYLVVAQVQYQDMNAATRVQCLIYKNGAAECYSSLHATTASTNFVSQASGIIDMNGTTDYIELYTVHEKGSDGTITNGRTVTWMSIIKVM